MSDPVAALTPCGECGQRVTPQERHTFLHCTLHKAGVNPADYGIVLVNAEGLAAALSLAPAMNDRPWRTHREEAEDIIAAIQEQDAIAEDVLADVPPLRKGADR